MSENPVAAEHSLSDEILDQVPVLICLVNAEGRVTYLNRTWQDLKGESGPARSIFWYDLFKSTDKDIRFFDTNPERCRDQKLVRLRSYNGGTLEAVMEWQSMVSPSGKGWLVCCHLRNRKTDTIGQDRPRLHPPLERGEAGQKPDILPPASQARLSETWCIGNQNAVCSEMAFEHCAEELLKVADRAGETAGMMLVDVDHLGDLNNLYGRDVGDKVLAVVADHLKRVILGNGIAICRDGDEFAILLRGNVSAATLLTYAETLIALVASPFNQGALSVGFGISIGGALYPQDGHSLAMLRHAASLALADVKEHGRGGFRLYDPAKNRRDCSVTQQANHVRQLLDEDLIYPVYQVKICLETGRMVGAEALLRWGETKASFSGPAALPEIFRSYDLASRVSARIHERIFEDIARWRRAGFVAPCISLNVAPVEFMHDDYAEKLLGRLSRHDLAASMIEIELTEHVLYRSSEHYIHRALCALKKAGAKITLDDFGTGYSSLGFLRDFPVSSFKIDQSFISKICTEPSMEVIVEAMIRFGDAISVVVVAEGIETAEQLALLKRIKCPIGQGFLFGPPVDAAGFVRLLAAGTTFPV